MKTTQEYINDTIGQARAKANFARRNLEEMDAAIARAERIRADLVAELEALEKKVSAAQDTQVRRLVRSIMAGKEATHLRDSSDEALVSELTLAKQQVAIAAKALAELANSRAPLAAAAEAAGKALSNLIRAEHAAVSRRLLTRLDAIAAEYNDVCLMIHALNGISSGIPGQQALVLTYDVGAQLGVRTVGGAAGQPGHTQGVFNFGPHRVTWESYFENYRAGNAVEMPKTERELEAERFDRMINEAVARSIAGDRNQLESQVSEAVGKAVSEATAAH